MLMADNTGATNHNRALNYLAVRYKRIYEKVAEAFARDESLTCVDVRRSPLSGAREIVDVIFSFTSRHTDVVNKHFVRVDVTDEFPIFDQSVVAVFRVLETSSGSFRQPETNRRGVGRSKACFQGSARVRRFTAVDIYIARMVPRPRLSLAT